MRSLVRPQLLASLRGKTRREKHAHSIYMQGKARTATILTPLNSSDTHQPTHTKKSVRLLTAVGEDRARGFYLRFCFLEHRAQEADPRLLHRGVVRSELQRLGTIPGKVQLESFVACRKAPRAIVARYLCSERASIPAASSKCHPLKDIFQLYVQAFPSAFCRKTNKVYQGPRPSNNSARKVN